MDENYESVESLEKELEKVRQHRFEIAMIDRWDDGCFRIDRQLCDREHELEEKLRERGCKI